MNARRVSRLPGMELVIVALILLAAGGVAIMIAVAWPLIHAPSGQADPWQVVNDFHVAINNNNVDGVPALFAEGAVISEGQSRIDDRDQIRNWVLSSERMAGLHLKMVHSEREGEKLIWLDNAYNGPEGQSRYYILRWEAVIAEGKIQSLVVTPRVLPGLK
jgi:hypothetical protein